MDMKLKNIFALACASIVLLASEVKANEVDCLAQAIHHEANGESYLGKLAVGHVILNRTKNSKFKYSTICGIVTSKGQFTNFKLGKHKPSTESYKAANDVFNTKDPTNGALFFKVYKGKSKGLVIGHHVFRRSY